MRVRDVPFVGFILASGADDHVFDAFLLTGPLVVVTVSLVGRSALTTTLAVAYLVGLLGYTLAKGLE